MTSPVTHVVGMVTRNDLAKFRQKARVGAIKNAGTVYTRRRLKPRHLNRLLYGEEFNLGTVVVHSEIASKT